MNTLRILIIEDDDLIGMLLAEMFKGMGHHVVGIAVTEAEAVLAAAQHKPDLMTVDGRLQNGSGRSALQSILRAGFVPHIFISGDMAHAPPAPGAAVLRKPFSEAALVQAMSKALAVTPPVMAGSVRSCIA